MIELGNGITSCVGNLEVGDVVASVATTKAVGSKVATLLSLAVEQTLYCDWPGYSNMPYPGKMFRELGEVMGANRVRSQGNFSASAPDQNFMVGSLDKLFYLDFVNGGGDSKKSVDGGATWTTVTLTLPADSTPIFRNGRSKINYIAYTLNEETTAQRIYVLPVSGSTITKGRLLNPDTSAMIAAKISINNTMGFWLYDWNGTKTLRFGGFDWKDIDSYAAYNLNVPDGDWENLDPLSGSASEACVLWSGSQVAFPEAVAQDGLQITVTWKVYDLTALGLDPDNDWIGDVVQPTGNTGGNVYVSTNKGVLLFKKSDNYASFTLIPGTDKLKGNINYCVPDSVYGVDFIYSSDSKGQYLYYSVLSSRSAAYPVDHTWHALMPLDGSWNSSYLTTPTLTSKSGLNKEVPGAVMQDGTSWRANSSHMAGNPAFPFVVPAYPDAGVFVKLVGKIE